MQVVGHDVDVVQVLLHLERLHAPQQVAGGGGGDGEQVVLAVGGARAVELLAQRLHQGRVALDQAGPAGVGQLPVERVARVLHRGRVLVVDVDAVEAVGADEVDRGLGEGVDAGLVDGSVGVGGHRVEAAGGDPVAVVAEVAAGLGPAADRDERLDVRVLLLEFVQQVEVALVGERRVHLGSRDAGPGHPGGGVVRVVGADRDLVVGTHVGEGVVQVGDLGPRDVAGQVGGGAVLARAPAGEVSDDAALVVGAHLLAALGVVDRAVGNVDAGRLVEAVGATALVVGRVRDARRESADQQSGDCGAGCQEHRSRTCGGRHCASWGGEDAGHKWTQHGAT